MILKLLKLQGIFFLMGMSLLQSNPLPVPQAFISELAFDSTGSWILEINFQFSTPFNHHDYDSICLASSHGKSFLRLDRIQDGSVFIIVSSDSLQSPLSITSEGDCLKLYSYTPLSGDGFVDSVSFGNYPGSHITTLPKGFSICRLGYSIFCRDKSPTLGLPNDTAGTYGILQGHLFDKNNTLMTAGNFRFDDSLTTDMDGNYRTKIFARKVIWDKIEMYIAPYTSKYEYIDTVCLDIFPDTAITRDIHLVNYVVEVQREYETPNTEVTVVNYPNPFNSSTTFTVTLPNGHKNRGAFLHIYTVTGEEILVIPLMNASAVTWDGKDRRGTTVSSGVYYYRLQVDNTLYASGSMIFLK